MSARFGFRDFETRQGQFLLNGVPVFLRGWSINPPGRGLPPVAANRSFAEGYLRFMKEQAGVNAVRIGDGASTENQHWYDVCDEIGMLIYAGPYGGVQCPECQHLGPQQALASAVTRYQSVLMDTASHPSHVVLILSNEVGLDSSPSWHSGKSADAAFLKNVSEALAAWDDSRAFLGDAGFGLGRGGEINDDHTYYGWYIGDANSYTIHGENHSLLSGEELPASQPQTFTECVGNYLTAGGDFDVAGKNWAWALKWAGNSQGQHAADEHAAYVAKQSIEIVRRRRRFNPSLAGIMPFHSPFYYCGDHVQHFADISSHPSPVLRQQKTSFAEVLLSIEHWTPHGSEGAALPVQMHVVVDKDDGRALAPTTLHWSWEVAGGAASVHGGQEAVPATPHYQTSVLSLNLSFPAVPSRLSAAAESAAPTAVKLVAKLMEGDATIATNEEVFQVFPAKRARSSHDRKGAEGSGVSVYDPLGATARALRQLGLPATAVSSLHNLDAKATPSLLIGEDVWSGDAMAAHVRACIEAGGRVAILQQSMAPAVFDPGFIDPGLVSFDMQDKVGHSGRNVSNVRKTPSSFRFPKAQAVVNSKHCRACAPGRAGTCSAT